MSKQTQTRPGVEESCDYCGSGGAQRVLPDRDSAKLCGKCNFAYHEKDHPEHERVYAFTRVVSQNK